MSSQVYSDPGKTKFHVIIDTDGGMDDLRAICMILAWKEFEILAITTSNGICSSGQAYHKVTGLLDHFGHQGIPVGMGKKMDIGREPCMEKVGKLPWAGNNRGNNKGQIEAVELIHKTAEQEDQPVYFLGLGPLTNLSAYLTEQNNKNIRLVWLNEDPSLSGGTNYNFDRDAAESVSVGIDNLTIVTPPAESIFLDGHFTEGLKNTEGRYSELLHKLHSSEKYAFLKGKEAFKMGDELVPLYLAYPGLFNVSGTEIKTARYKGERDEAIQKSMVLLSGNTNMSNTFNSFPVDEELYAEDVKEIVKKVIGNYGREEWRVGVLTQELHGHFGIYSIIGTKMGLRARDYFNIGIDDLAIVSYAGRKPPLSCMNDGLQVSTGGTLGHGLISVSEETPHLPAATFEFKGRKVGLELKQEYWQQIKEDIGKTIEKCGALTPEYWQEVRRLALGYWIEFSRHDIFELEQLH